MVSVSMYIQLQLPLQGSSFPCLLSSLSDGPGTLGGQLLLIPLGENKTTTAIFEPSLKEAFLNTGQIHTRNS